MQVSDAELEASVQALVAANRQAEAAEAALRHHGDAIHGFLCARIRSTSEADEAFSQFCIDVWRGIAMFQFRCSLKSWLYCLARNASNRLGSARNRRHEQPHDPESAAFHELSVSIRTSTRSYLKTEVKDRFRALRAELPEEDQTLLILYVDRGLRWRELAVAMSDEGEALTGDALTKEAARLRKRFERIKETLRDLAIAKGLFAPTARKPG